MIWSCCFSDFDQLPLNIPISATIADIEEIKGFIDYFVSIKKTKGLRCFSLRLAQNTRLSCFFFSFIHASVSLSEVRD